jgi:hypothetical protein
MTILTLFRISDLRMRKRDLELRAALHGETLREKNQQIQAVTHKINIDGSFFKTNC